MSSIEIELKSLPIYPISSIILDYYSNPVFDKVMKDLAEYKNVTKCYRIDYNSNGYLLDIQIINYSGFMNFCIIVLSTGKVLIFNLNGYDTDPINLEEYYIKCPIIKLTPDNMSEMLIKKDPLINK